MDKRVHQYIAIVHGKIGDYLKRHKNEVYFSDNAWRSKFIKMDDQNFNPEKEIVFTQGKDLFHRNVTLELLKL